MYMILLDTPENKKKFVDNMIGLSPDFIFCEEDASWMTQDIHTIFKNSYGLHEIAHDVAEEQNLPSHIKGYRISEKEYQEFVTYCISKKMDLIIFEMLKSGQAELYLNSDNEFIVELNSEQIFDDDDYPF